MTDKLSPPAQKLREAGYKLTHARLTVIDVLEDSEGHLSTADVLERVEQRDPTIGRASVYRTLELLTNLGIIWTAFQGSPIARYVLTPGGHHHHVVCLQCHRVLEFDDCRLDDLAHDLQNQIGVRIMGHLLEFYGLCDECAA